MPTLCLQCAMRALLNGEPAPAFEEEPVDHMKRAHPDPQATIRERQELEDRLRKRLAMNPTIFTR